MWNFVYFLFVAAGVLAVAQLVISLRKAAAGSSPKLTQRPAPRKVPRVQVPVAEAAPLAWDGAPVDPVAVARATDSREQVRERYIAARFPGLVGGAADLERVDDVVKVARLYFEEDRDDQAHELLTLAIERLPQNETLRLAQIEIAFLRRQRGWFLACATDFRAALPQSRNWNEVARLGRTIAPENKLFATGTVVPSRPHFGPWPDLPNWIQASWDFTPDVLAADFHRGIVRSPAGRAANNERISLGA